ncbi:MAG: hypothetical protein P8X91_08805 [Candidatus Bathyarchaeota archaeon]|jgi:hypothetical protein
MGEPILPRFRIRDYLGPVADPAPELLKWWLENLAADQIKVVLAKDIEQKINVLKFQIQNLNSEIEKLEIMRSMIKEKGMAHK